MNFENKYHGSMYLFGQEVWITDTLIYTWIIGGLLILFALYVRLYTQKFKQTPKGFQNFLEIIVESMDKFVIGTMDKKYSYFANWFFGIMIFIFISNISGLIGFRPPTADLATTLALAITSFLLIHILGMFKSKSKYFKSYLEPYALFLPLNIISELAIPISLSFRLFGNILAGTIIMTMIYALPDIFNIGIPAVLHIYFDLFAGALQAYIFVILSMTFIRTKLPD